MRAFLAVMLLATPALTEVAGFTVTGDAIEAPLERDALRRNRRKR